MVRDLHTGRLAASMYARVGSTRSRHSHRLATEPGERGFKLPLHRASIRLDLPAGKPGAVVVQNELEDARCHLMKRSRRRV